MKKVVLITGASSGIGEATAQVLAKEGHIVYGAARSLDKMKHLTSEGVSIIKLDVTKEDSMSQCVNTILEKEGRIDVLVNNAGYGSFGAVEDVSIDEARRQIEVNLLGLARMVQLVLPSMRKYHNGIIINMSSMGGKMYTPYGAWYHATKFAVEGFSDCLRMEVASFGIDVVLIEPGIIKTDWVNIAADNLKKTSFDGAYSESAVRVANKMRTLYRGKKPTNPQAVAGIVSRIISTQKPKTRYTIGYLAKSSIFLRRVLTDRLFDKIMGKIQGL